MWVLMVKFRKRLQMKLLKKNMIDFLGSDLHHLRQFKFLEESLQKKEIQKLCKSSKLLNKHFVLALWKTFSPYSGVLLAKKLISNIFYHQDPLRLNARRT